jgi:hypothetical protein
MATAPEPGMGSTVNAADAKCSAKAVLEFRFNLNLCDAIDVDRNSPPA